MALGDHAGRAVWDSGAGLTVIDETFLSSWRHLCEELGSSSGTDVTGQSRRTPLVLLPELSIGGRTFAPSKAAVVDLAVLNASLERPMDLIIGYPLFSQAEWLFDFPNDAWAVR